MTAPAKILFLVLMVMLWSCNGQEDFGYPPSPQDAPAPTEDIVPVGDVSAMDWWIFETQSDVAPDTDLFDAEPCVPDCTGRECGDDGCVGSCGTCGASDKCNDTTGECEADCASVCASKECGTVAGCNCGDCATGYFCNGGKCIECDSHATKKCQSSYIYWFDSCNNKEELYQNCSVRCDELGADYYDCVFDPKGEGHCKCKYGSIKFLEFDCSDTNNTAINCGDIVNTYTCVAGGKGFLHSGATEYHCDQLKCPSDGDCSKHCGQDVYCGGGLQLECQCDIINNPLCSLNNPNCIYK
ncbi:MAG: hypothetical protein ABIK09_10485 [Pseudomonadota bacterium]